MKIIEYTVIFLIGAVIGLFLKKTAHTKLIMYHADATGVDWFAMHDDNFITPWCILPTDAIANWTKKEVYDIKNDRIYKLWLKQKQEKEKTIDD